jgi:cyclophilin family peptidyl-prolyl cis-trans isomerase
MKKLLFVIAFIATTSTGFSQIGAGVNLGFTRYPDADKSFLTYGAHGMYGGIKDGKIAVRAMFNTGGYKETDEIGGEQFDAKFRMNLIALDALYHFGKGSTEDGGFYVAPGLGLALASSTVGEASESASQLYIRANLGYNLVLDSGIGIFGEAFVNLPPNANSEGEAVEINIYGTLGLNFGVRKNF